MESTAWNPEFTNVLDSLTWGDFCSESIFQQLFISFSLLPFKTLIIIWYQLTWFCWIKLGTNWVASSLHHLLQGLPIILAQIKSQRWSDGRVVPQLQKTELQLHFKRNNKNKHKTADTHLAVLVLDATKSLVLTINTNHPVGNLVHNHKIAILTWWENGRLQSVSKLAEQTEKSRKNYDTSSLNPYFLKFPKRNSQLHSRSLFRNAAQSY